MMGFLYWSNKMRQRTNKTNRQTNRNNRGEAQARIHRTVRRRDGDAACLLLGRLVDLVKRHRRRRPVRLGQHARDRRRQRRLSVVDVADGADVDVGLGAAVDVVRGHAAAAGGGDRGARPQRGGGVLALLQLLLRGPARARVCVWGGGEWGGERGVERRGRRVADEPAADSSSNGSSAAHSAHAVARPRRGRSLFRSSRGKRARPIRAGSSASLPPGHRQTRRTVRVGTQDAKIWRWGRSERCSDAHSL